MSLTLRRTVSFATVVATVVATALIYTRLPGADGTLSELHWILSHRPPERQLRRAGALLLLADDAEPGTENRYLKALLDSADRLIVDGALTILSQRLWLVQSRPSSSAKRSLFDDWFESASDETKWAQIGPMLLIAFPVLMTDCTVTLDAPRDPMADTYKYARWWVAATTHPDKRVNRSLGTSFIADIYEPGGIRERLAYMNGRSVPAEPYQTVSSWPEMDVRIEVVSAAHDQFPQVRWAAARIMAVCKDDRALDSVYEWLQSDPNAPASANQVLDELFGPDWRKPFEK